MFRKTVVTALVAAMITLTAAPAAFAGPTEQAFLAKLTNTWTGRGKLSGANTGPIACKIVISGGGKSAKFQGRCNIPDLAQQAFSGSISYNDKTKQYESRSAGGAVPGIRKGDKLVFRSSSRNLGGTATSTMTISPSSLVVDFAMADKKGEKTTSRVTFTR